jgi:hypothetical protein
MFEIAELNTMKQALSQLKSAQPAGLGGASLLKLDRQDGEWVFGVDSTPVGDDEVAINPVSFVHGWVCWGDATILGEEMVSIAKPAPTKPEPVQGNAWSFQLGFGAALLDGTQLVYKTTAMGGLEFVQNLASEIATGDGVVPIVRLTATHYKHKKYGRIYKPAFELVRWSDNGQAAEEPPRRRRRA